MLILSSQKLVQSNFVPRESKGGRRPGNEVGFRANHYRNFFSKFKDLKYSALGSFNIRGKKNENKRI